MSWLCNATATQRLRVQTTRRDRNPSRGIEDERTVTGFNNFVVDQDGDQSRQQRRTSVPVTSSRHVLHHVRTQKGGTEQKT